MINSDDDDKEPKPCKEDEVKHQLAKGHHCCKKAEAFIIKAEGEQLIAHCCPKGALDRKTKKCCPNGEYDLKEKRCVEKKEPDDSNKD